MEYKPKVKLKNLEVTKVDVVDNGADQLANIMIKKRDSQTEEKEPFYKRFFNSVCQSLNLDGNAVKKAAEAYPLEEAVKKADIESVMNEVKDTCNALNNSINSIIQDDTVIDKASAIMKSADQFHEFVSGASDQWADYRPTNQIIKSESKDDFEENDETEEKSDIPKVHLTDDLNVNKEEDDMRLDVDKMSPVEKAFYEDLKKKYAVDDTEKCGTTEKGEDTEKLGDTEKCGDTKKGDQEEEKCDTLAKGEDEKDPEDVDENITKAVRALGEEIFKGLTGQINSIIEPVKKRADEIKNAELVQVAKKYEILGVKADEFVPVLKALQETSQDAYDQFIKTMDTNAKAIEESGIFSEIGKSGSFGSGSMTSGDAYEVIQKRASDMMNKDSSLSMYQAIDKVCMQDPELAKAWENQ